MASAFLSKGVTITMGREAIFHSQLLVDGTVIFDRVNNHLGE